MLVAPIRIALSSALKAPQEGAVARSVSPPSQVVVVALLTEPPPPSENFTQAWLNTEFKKFKSLTGFLVEPSRDTKSIVTVLKAGQPVVAPGEVPAGVAAVENN